MVVVVVVVVVVAAAAVVVEVVVVVVVVVGMIFIVRVTVLTILKMLITATRMVSKSNRNAPSSRMFIVI